MVNVDRLTSDEQKAQWLVAEAHAHDGLAPVDLERFWADQEIARKDPFGPDIPQAAMGIHMSGECVFAELGVAEDRWRYDHDDAWRLGLNKAYNDKAEGVIGRRPLSEQPAAPPELRYPQHKLLHDVFEARNEWVDQSWWLMQSAHGEEELKALLDRVEDRDIRSFILPPDWHERKERLMKLGIRPPLYRSQRGPVTFATSIYGVEDLLFLILDNPALAGRLRDAILRTMLEIARVLDDEAGYTPQTAPRHFAFFDDNCCLLTPEMYEFFGCPVLKGVFEGYGPDASDWRYQHSDSAMGHLLPVLGRLDFSQVNFGPTVAAGDIRRHMPRTIIEGQLAPFTFSRNQEERMVREFLRDYAAVGAARGLLFATAGSINNGSRLTGMRLIMSAIQHFGRY